MTTYYIDLSDKAAARLTDGQSEVNYWNLNDVITGTTKVLVDGDTLKIKGIDLDYHLYKIVVPNFGDELNVEPWESSGEMTSFAVHGLGIFGDTTTLKITRGILDVVYGMQNNFTHTSCVLISDIGISLRSEDSLGSDPIVQTFRGCTLRTHDKFIEIYNYADDLTEQTVNFYSCLIIDTVFDAGSQGTNDVINCINCTFVGKTEAEVKDDFEAAGGTITFTNCRFNVTLPTPFPLNLSDIAGNNLKHKLLFDTYNDGSTALLGHPGYDYSSDGDGLFGGIRIGVGAWWFPTSYHVNLDSASDSGTGDGLTYANRMGTTAFKGFINPPFNAIAGRYVRERDRFILEGEWTLDYSSGDRMPYDEIPTFGYFQGDVDNSDYKHLYFEAREGQDPFRVISAQNPDWFDLFGGMEFIRMIAHSPFFSVPTIVGGLNDAVFRTCLLFDESSIEIVGTGLLPISQFKFYGSTILTPSFHPLGTISTHYGTYRFKNCMFADDLVFSKELISGSPENDWSPASIIFDFCRFDNEDALDDISAYTLNIDNVLGAVLATTFPTVFANLVPNNLKFSEYNLIGSLMSVDLTWERDESDFGLLSNTAIGIGAFYFDGLGASNYYVDFDAVASGTGTPGSPWTKAQMLDYFISTGVTPFDGDEIRCRGDYIESSDDLIPLDVPDSITITMKAWDVAAYGIPIIELGASANARSLFSIAAGKGVPSINVRDFGVFAPTGSGSKAAIISTADGDGIVRMYNSLIISDVDLYLSDDAGADNFLYGSTLSIGRNGGLESVAGNSRTLTDCVLNIHYLASITSVAMDFETCETNKAEIDFNLGTSTDNTFGSSAPTQLPESLTIAGFDIANFKYDVFGFSNVGKGAVYWDANGYNYGIGGLPRDGIGAFYFLVDRTLYADFSGAISGDGSELLPFTYQQIVNYFNPDDGLNCYTFPVAGDLVRIKGIANTTNSTIFNIKRNIPLGTVTLEAWDIETNGVWLIETKTGPSDTDLTFISNEPGYTINGLSINDFIFLQNNSGVSNVIVSGIDPGSELTPVNLALKNFMIYTTNNLRFNPLQFLTMKCYGINISAEEVDLTPDGDLYLYDGVIKASFLKDYDNNNYGSLSESPSTSLSASPSESPSTSLSASPSQSPSSSPSNSPSQSPSSSPSMSPSNSPSNSPSESPSTEPETSSWEQVVAGSGLGALLEYDSKLYVGGANHRVYEWDNNVTLILRYGGSWGSSGILYTLDYSAELGEMVGSDTPGNKIGKIDPNTWLSTYVDGYSFSGECIDDVGNGNVFFFDRLLGAIYKSDLVSTTTLASNVIGGSGAWSIVFGGKLWTIRTDGSVYEFDGTSTLTSRGTATTIGASSKCQLIEFNGELYAKGKTGTLSKYTAPSTWTVVATAPVGGSLTRIAEHDSKLWLIDDDFFVWVWNGVDEWIHQTTDTKSFIGENPLEFNGELFATRTYLPASALYRYIKEYSPSESPSESPSASPS